MTVSNPPALKDTAFVAQLSACLNTTNGGAFEIRDVNLSEDELKLLNDETMPARLLEAIKSFIRGFAHVLVTFGNILSLGILRYCMRHISFPNMLPPSECSLLRDKLELAHEIRHLEQTLADTAPSAAPNNGGKLSFRSEASVYSFFKAQANLCILNQDYTQTQNKLMQHRAR